MNLSSPADRDHPTMICGLRIPRLTLSRTNWKHFCLTLTRISAFAAPCEFGLYKCHYYYYYYYQFDIQIVTCSLNIFGGQYIDVASNYIFLFCSAALQPPFSADPHQLIFQYTQNNYDEDLFEFEKNFLVDDERMFNMFDCHQRWLHIPAHITA